MVGRGVQLSARQNQPKTRQKLILKLPRWHYGKSIEQAYADASASLKNIIPRCRKSVLRKSLLTTPSRDFDVGMMNSFDYNTSKKDLTKAQSDLLQAKYDFIFKTTILDFYMGKPISINK